MINEITNNNLPQPYFNTAGKKILEYASPDTIVLDLHFILTKEKKLTRNMPYMLLEKKVAGIDTSAIRLLNYQHYQGVVYLNVQNLQTNRCFNLSWNLEVDSEGWWVFSLSDLETLTDMTK